MKTAEEISSDIAKTITADPDSGVTFSGIKGSLRGYIDAVAFKIRDLWYDITQAKRDSMIDTCNGTALDNYITQRSDLARLTASKSGVLLVLTGVVGTVIPVGTIVTNPTTKIRYVTLQEVSIGGKGNSSFAVSGVLGLKTISVADIVWAECMIAGIIGRAPANSITSIGISGVSVTNPAPAQGGADDEDDNTFRQRFKDYIKVLNKNTKPFYQELVRSLNSNILRTNVEKDYSHPDSIKLTVVAKSGNPLPSADLSLLDSQIQEKNRAGEIINSVNIDFTEITVEFQVLLIGVNGQAVNRDKYFSDTADALAKFLDWSLWKWDSPVSVDDLFTVCQTIPQVMDIPLNSFKINGVNGVSVPVQGLPYFTSLTIIDITNASVPTVKSSLSVVQNFINLQLSPIITTQS